MTKEELIIKLYTEDSLSVNKIQKRIGGEKKKISSILESNGIKLKRKVNWSLKKPLSSDIENFKKLYKIHKSSVTVGKLTGWSNATVIKYLGDEFQKGTKELTEDTIQEIQKLYNEGMSSREVSKELNISKTSVLKFINNSRESSSYRKYNLDKNAFESITTEKQAYWLGFLYADGSVSSTEHSITLSLTDKESVEQFREFLKTDKPIYVRKKSEVNPKWKDNYTLTVHSKKLKKDLIKLGCIPNKTEKLDRVPDLPEHLYRHFVRGIFDGDGSIWKSQERFHFSISGYLPFIDKVQDVIVKETGLNKTKLAKRKHNYGDIRYGGKKNLSVLKDYLYKDATVYMSRKKNTFNLILN